MVNAGCWHDIVASRYVEFGNLKWIISKGAGAVHDDEVVGVHDADLAGGAVES